MQETPKPAALARVVDIANQLESGNPNARTLVRDLFAAFTEVMAHFEAAQPIDTLVPEPGAAYLVFSPDQGGWNLARWREHWSDAHLPERRLAPSHWLRLPPEPDTAQPAEAAPASSAPPMGVSLFITRAQKATLRERGFSAEAIKHMKPEEAHRHLLLNTAQPGDETSDSRPSGADQGSSAEERAVPSGILHVH
jgi:hypothetical protein